MREMIRLENLSKSFAGLEVIKNISFTLSEGEVLSIIGPSGSGKSTMLRIITQLERADNGTLSVDGMTMFRSVDGKAVYSRPEELRKIGLKMGLVFQSFNLFPHFSVLRNITEAQRAVLKRERAEAEDKAMNLLKKMGIADKANQYPFQLSGGMARRVLVSTAAISGAELIIADEPTPGMTLEQAVEALRVFRELADEGRAVVLITHDVDLACAFADRIAVFYAGTTVETASAEEFRAGESALRHPYSRALWRALPQNGFEPISGRQPYAGSLPDGCLFAPRCPMATDECRSGRIPMRGLRGGEVRCIHAT